MIDRSAVGAFGALLVALVGAARGPGESLRPAALDRHLSRPVDPDLQLSAVTLRRGHGRTVRAGDTVTVRYAGPAPARVAGTGAADAGRVAQFVLGEDEVGPGWEEGIAGMKVGETRRLVIPPSMLYGAAPQAAPLAPVVNEVEVIAVHEDGHDD